MSEFHAAEPAQHPHTRATAELAAAGFDDAEEIGRGGFGIVYRCRQHALDRFVAVKMLTSQVREDERQQFIREQRALGRLSGHPHILQVLQVDVTASGSPFIVTPFHAKGSLEQLLRSSGPLRWPDVLSIGVKVSGALAAAHAIGIVHRDVKPGNILLTDYGEPQLADFGIAQMGDVATVAVAMIQGTPAFTAPEVLSGATPTAAADIYGLGATLFSLLTGHAAFARRTGELLQVQLARIATAPIPNLRESGIPDSVCSAVEAAMATDPAARPGSAIEFGERLREVQREYGQPIDVLTVPPSSDGEGVDRASTLLPVHSLGSVTPAPPPTASTRFRSPTSAGQLIERTRLLELLRQGGSRRLTLIHGPAGFGKTTLAAQWGRHLESEGIPTAWLTVDTDDNNVIWFLAHLVEAIRRVRPESARELGTLLEQRTSDTVRYVLSALIDDIHAGGLPVVLIIDDWDRVSADSTIRALDLLLESGCHHLRVVVVGRTRSGLPITRMLIHDELVEIDVSALRFDGDEANSFLVELNRLPLPATDVASLRESTEGWPAALQLASLALRAGEDPASFIDRLTGRHHVIGEYLAEHVLGSLEPRLLDFLQSTSVVDRVCAELAAVLSGRADSQDLLAELVDRNLFLERLDEQDKWFRYHRLFADFLRSRLLRRDPDRLAELQARASVWLAEHGLLTEAVDYAMAAGDPGRAVDLVEARAVDLIERFSATTFLGLMAKLPGSITEARPRLQLCAAWANLGLRRPEPMRTALHNALAAISTGAVPEPDATTMRAEAAMVTSIEQYVSDQLDGLPEVLVEHLRDASTPFSALAAAFVGAIDAMNRLDFDSVIGWLLWAAPYHRSHSSPFLVVHGRCVAGLTTYEQLDIGTAEQLFRGAVAEAERSAPQSDTAVLPGTLLGALRYDQGHLAEAEDLLGAGTAIGNQGVQVEFLAAIYGTGARLAALRGDLTRAEDLLDRGAYLAEAGALPRLAARIINERVRAGLSISSEDRAYLFRLPLYQVQANRIRAETRELEQDSLIRLLLAEGSPAAIREAGDRADHLVHAIETQSRPKALIQTRLLRCCCLWAAGRRDEALAVAQPALSKCAELGLPRFAADAGPYLVEIAAAPA